MLSVQPFESSDVLLQKVPAPICQSRVFLDAMLEQAGLEEAVVSVEVLRKHDRVTGELLVTLSSKLAAQLCVQMIDGALWTDARGNGPVRARLLARQPAAAESTESSLRQERIQDSPEAVSRSSPGAGIKDDRFCGGAKSDASDSDEATTTGPEPSSPSEDTSDDDRQLSLSPSFSPSRGARWADISDSEEEL